MHIKEQKNFCIIHCILLIIRDKIIKYLMFPLPFSYVQDLFKILRYTCYSILTPKIHPALLVYVLQDASEQYTVPASATDVPITDFALQENTCSAVCAV